MYRPMLIGSILLGMTSAVTAADLYAEDYASIQAAIEAASDGDAVIISPGIHSESLNTLGKAITLRSVDPHDAEIVDATILDGSDLDASILHIESGEWRDTVIDGLTFRNGAGTHYDASNRHGGAIYVDDSSPWIRRCTFINNQADHGGAIGLTYSWSVISACRFEGNQASGMNWHGGGAIGAHGGKLRVVNSTFIGNEAINATRGGAIYASDGSRGSIVGSVFARNSAYSGGAIRSEYTSLDVANCTFASNSATDSTDTIYAYGGETVRLQNSLIADDPAGVATSGSAEVLVQSSLLGVDPSFVDPANDNYRLRADSIAVNEGSHSLIMYDFGDVDGDGDEWEPLPLDADGNPRVAEGETNEPDAVDLGAYEFSGEPAPACPYDLNGDTSVNFDDLIVLIEAWGPLESAHPADFNDDGVVSMADLTVLLTSWGPCP